MPHGQGHPVVLLHAPCPRAPDIYYSHLPPENVVTVRTNCACHTSHAMMVSANTSPFMNIEALCAAPPEALAHSRSQMPLSCPVAPPSQRELHQDGGGGGGGVAMRARAARAPKAMSCATSCVASSAAPCAASFTCSFFMSPKGRRVGGLASGSPRAAAYLFSPERLRSPRPLRARPSRAVLHWACRTNKGLRTFKERAAMKKPLMKKPFGDWG